MNDTQWYAFEVAVMDVQYGKATLQVEIGNMLRDCMHCILSEE